ncbi:Glycoside hydrolase [Macleaya cordata]|uniref:xyloglucan:xyloglucosyl transferase n=1 Tax=Macleaya cordata TaxID=56857 RepID=A0A200RC49_MACCD|nr:Glycoside hydrolase [Macleaya cordata]
MGVFFGGQDDFGVSNGDEQSLVQKSSDFETEYKGSWELAATTSGVSSMHLQLFPTNKAIMFDATVFGPSPVRLPGACRRVPKTKELDCFAHAVEYDIETAEIRPLKILTDTWCSSGGLAPDGTLVNTGGWDDGKQAVRYLKPCENCDWTEYPLALSGQRWYSTQQILPDGSFIVVGGRRMFNYEFVPVPGKNNPTAYNLPLLRETTDIVENNLYPFVHLSTDGNLFIFANSRSILLNPNTKQVIREFPVLQGGARNYPSSGMSALLPIKLHGENAETIPAEVMVCGGSKPDAPQKAEKGIFMPALTSCGRIQITKPNAAWKMETMPSPRVMGDMLNLPTGDLLMINGAKAGASGWLFADDPNFTPVIYRPMKPKDDRFIELEPTTIPRMYHSSSALLPDGKILVAGSNTNNVYKFTGVKYPTELRVEKFYPPYLDPLLDVHRPTIITDFGGDKLKYGEDFSVQIRLTELPMIDKSNIKVTIYSPPFTTHGYSMNQRLVVLATTEVRPSILPGVFQIGTLAPPSGAVAPPGYYLLFVVHRGVPSTGVWIQIGNSQALFMALFVYLIAFDHQKSLVVVEAKFWDSTYFNWGAHHSSISNNGDDLQLVLDKTAGSGIETKKEFLFGSIEMLIKLVPGNSAGTVTAYYLSSQGSKHDEIDFEFLGNVSGKPYIIHTNVFAQGIGNREQQFYPWFDPTADFHNYTIHWNPTQIVWIIDGIPIRVFRNYENMGIQFPNKQGMKTYCSLWNADNWATRGGLDKIDWKSSPFTARFRRFTTRACIWNGPGSISQCASKSPANWWNSPVYSKLNSAQIGQMKWVRDKFMIYDYCKDTKRFNWQMPRECSLPQF